VENKFDAFNGRYSVGKGGVTRGKELFKKSISDIKIILNYLTY
jgi:hypothetical protein